MKPEAQRIAIAEACGYVKGTHSLGFVVWRKGGFFYRANTLPDFLADLNAMHDAVQILEAEQKAAFVDALLSTATSHPMHALADFNALTATAAQRAEAFLRTLGKWEA